MKSLFRLYFFLPAFLFIKLWAQDCSDAEALMRDLSIVDSVNQKLCDRFPVTYDNLLRGGYINMPSARMGQDGEIGFGYSHVHPYINYNLRIQLTSRLELSGNYRIFKGLDDPILTPMGFGDLSDKGVNFKFSFFHPEDSQYKLPGFAFGYDDFIGTQNFRSAYFVLTKVFLEHDTEVTLGYGWHRFRGWFGGISWIPFRRSPYYYLQGLSLTAEYDATPYKDITVEKHPRGRKSKTPINLGIKYRLWDQIDFSYSYVRGKEWAFSASGYYNFGYTGGLLPKIDDALPYRAPTNIQPLGILRPEDVLVQDLIYPLEEQGFDLLQTWFSYDLCGQKVLRLRVINNSYLREMDVRNRLTAIVSALIPDNIDEVIVVIEGDGFPIQEYQFKMPLVRAYNGGGMGVYELYSLTPLREVTYPDPFNSSLLFQTYRNRWNVELFPKMQTLFGSSKGKFKYVFGLHLGLNGFVFSDIYYYVLVGFNMFNNMQGLSGIDRLNPSQIINVRTDLIEYYKQRGVSLDEAFLQKNWNMGRGWYAKLATGYFEEAYGGLSTEVLYYPVKGPFAIGAEASFLRKRNYRGLGFSDKVRKLHGFEKSYRRFIGKQYFINMYYTWYDCSLDFMIKAGKFLANDWGARFELSRYFPSGLRLNVWYTWTGARDRINGKTYHDKGVSFSMPLDIFYTHSERSRFGHGMSAWLRDVGVNINCGKDLYNMISEQRE